MPARKGLLAPQNTFLDTIATRFDGTHSNFVLGNAQVTSTYPIVYCSDGFCELTGHSRAQIMQKSCACDFLYGQKTDQSHIEAIAEALETKRELKLEVILYKRAGTPFWCLLDIVPIQNEKHEVVLLLCSHKDITRQKLQAHHHAHRHSHAHAQQAHSSNTHNSCSNKQQRDSTNNDANDDGDDDERNTTKSQLQASSTTSGAALAATAAATSTAITHANAIQANNETAFSSNSRRQDSAASKESSAASKATIDEFADFADCLLDSPRDSDSDCNSGSAQRSLTDADNSSQLGDNDKHTANLYSRRRSRAVLYQLSGHYGYGRGANMKSKLKLNNRLNIPEYKTTKIEKQRFIVSHYGLAKSCWDWLILIVSFYVAIVVPYNATFNSRDDSLGGCRTESMDVIVEVVFVIDIVLNFRTTFVNRKGEVVTRPQTICMHYIRGWFVVDFLAALPFDVMCVYNLYNKSRLNLNLLKLIRLLRLARLLQKMDRYTQYSYIILTLLMLFFTLIAHWCACIWYVIAMYEIERNPPGWHAGWLHQLSDKLNYDVVNSTDIASPYITALYFTLSSLTSVGFGNVSANTNPEKIFSIIIMLIGALMHAVVFGNVTALIRVLYAKRSNYQTLLRDLKEFFKLYQVPKELQQRMIDYFTTNWSLNHGIEMNEILGYFPEELRGDVLMHLHREVLSLAILMEAPQGFLKSLAFHIKPKFCCPTDYVIHKGDALNYLYLVCNGSMEVLQDNMVVAILGKGDLVGYDVKVLANFNSQELTKAIISNNDNDNKCDRGDGSSADSNVSDELNKTSGKASTTNNNNNNNNNMKNTSTSNSDGQLMRGFVRSSSDLKALTYCDLKCIHIPGLLEVLKLYPEFSESFHNDLEHDLTFNLRV